jgi:hypothetical protein
MKHVDKIQHSQFLQSDFCITKWEEVAATKLLQALQEPKLVKQDDNNERERKMENLVA